MAKPKTKRVLIKVTQQDIEQGKRHMCDYCPVALAAKRTLPWAKVVNYSGIHDGAYRIQKGSKTAHLPEIASDWIRAFDRGDRVEPINFYVDVPA